METPGLSSGGPEAEDGLVIGRTETVGLTWSGCVLFTFLSPDGDIDVETPGLLQVAQRPWAVD